jgi:hypothetical protein
MIVIATIHLLPARYVLFIGGMCFLAVLTAWLIYRFGTIIVGHLRDKLSPPPARPSTISIDQLRRLPKSPLLLIDPASDLSLGILCDALQRHCDDVFNVYLGGDSVNVVVEGLGLNDHR